MYCTSISQSLLSAFNNNTGEDLHLLCNDWHYVMIGIKTTKNMAF